MALVGKPINHVLSERLYQGCSANSRKYCKDRKCLPYEQQKQAVESPGKTLHQKARKIWLWKGHNTLLTDGTTVLMPDTLPQQSNQNLAWVFLLLVLSGLFHGVLPRKGKNRPVLKRHPKAYPLLTEPRDQACEAINT